MWGQILGAVAGPLAGGLLGARKASKAAKEAARVQQIAADQAGQMVTDTAYEANTGVGEAALRAGQNVSGVANTAADNIQDSATQANALLNPYAEAGQVSLKQLLESAQGPQSFRAEDLPMDPGYQFRIDQAVKAIQGSAAARSGHTGGGVLKPLNREIQGIASNEFARAFERFRTTKNDSYDRAMGITKLGFDATTRTGDNIEDATRVSGGLRIGGAEYEGNTGIRSSEVQGGNLIEAARIAAEAKTAGADARAAGIVGSGNAWADGIAGAGRAIGSGFTLASLLRKPRPTP